MMRKFAIVSAVAAIFACSLSPCMAAKIDEEINAVHGKPKARKALENKSIKTIKSDDASFLEKDYACRVLRIIGTKDAIPALAALLPDQKLSHISRYALESMPYPEAGEALRDAVAKCSGMATVGVLQSLGARGDKKAVSEIVPMLKNGNTEIAGAAAWALGMIATPKAGEAIEAFLDDAPAKLKQSAANAALTAAKRLVEAGNGDAAAKILQKLNTPKWPEHVRTGAFVGLLKADPDQTVKRLVNALKGDDPLLRDVAIANVSTLEVKGLSNRIAAQLPDLQPKTQVLLIGSLAKRNDASVRSSIAAMVSSPSSQVRAAALKALGKVGDRSSVKLLVGALARAHSNEEKRLAGAALRTIAGKGVDAAIVKAMKTAKPETRVELIRVLGVRGASGTVPELIEQAADDNADIRKISFKVLGELAQPRYLPAIVKLLADLDGNDARKEAERAVVMVANKMQNRAKRADAAVAALDDADTTAATCSLLNVLAGIGNAKAFKAVSKALDDGSADVQDAAVRGLAEWPDARALDSLLKVFRTTDNKVHRVLALRGCVRLLGMGNSPGADAVRIYSSLLEKARGTAEKKLILGGLAKVPDASAFDVVEPLLGDDAVKAEAELAMLNIASAVSGSAPKRAKTIAKKLSTAAASPSVRKKAAAVLRQIEKFDGYIVAWQVAGPYTTDGSTFDKVFPAEKADAKGVSWKTLPVSNKGDKPWMLNLLKALGGNSRSAYVRTWVHSDKKQPARIEFGTDDGNKLWLNGELIHAKGAGGEAIPGEHKVKVTLKKGWNPLKLKVTQDTGPWEFCLRIRDPEGNSLDGISFKVGPPK